MNRSSAIRQQLVLWGLVLGLWGLLVLAFAGQLVFTAALPWTQALGLSLRDWLPWAFLAPAAAWLAFRFPLERSQLHLSIPVHVLACMLAVLTCEQVTRRIAPPPGPARGGLPDRFPGGFPPADGPPLRPGPRLPEDMPPGGPDFPPPGPRRALVLNRLAMQARFNLPIYWVIVSIVQTLTWYRRSQDRERKALELEARLAEAKLQALRMQLHPHFLFNALNAIATLVHKDPHAADEMIANLSELLRVTLDTAEQEIPLRQELAFLDRYLGIQQVRFGDRLRIEKEIDATSLEAQVPALILQPLVENAIRHGIEPQPAPGVVVIGARRQDDRLQLAVRDNGGGMTGSVKQLEGIGLANTKARLQELYGKDARLALRTPAEGGCSVELEIPYHENPRLDR